MDKSWMHKSRLFKDYELGTKNFINFGFYNTNDVSIHCPCLKFRNCAKQSRTTIRDHLYINEIDESYKIGMANNYLTHPYTKNLLSFTLICMKRMMLEV